MLTPALLATGLTLWPAQPGVRRLAGLRDGASSGREKVRYTPRLGRMAAVVAALACVLVAGIAVTIGGGFLVAAVLLHRRSRMRARETVLACDELAASVRGVVTEIRAGAHPVAAVEAVAREAPAWLGRRWRTLAVSARQRGSPTGLRRSDEKAPGPGAVQADLVFARVSAAWSLSTRHGIPLAEVLDAVYRDVEATARSARGLDARLAGARAGAAVLACLPVAGLALGEAMGAGPVGVLLGMPTGSVLFVAGALLQLAGVAWTSKLTGRVLP
ncbi:pilus assembly protein TadB [Saccharomonospora piscinae]|uniref:type II secretion system F family protein n=1 Tax=Saccharomonospora piscinae TaxID=687388 RepID=UPI001105C10B|nr:type II secretion system F family protein [Saccharomonospora piscinae]TLW92999.1 pilus assembly protein TadB [Saccharomonospora piscinae]